MKEHVLLVDDDDASLISLSRALSVSGLEVKIHAVASAEKALQTASNLRPGVAVVDLCLDEKIGVESGFSLIAALLELDPTCRIIVLTGHGSVEHGVRSLDSGAASFVEKPAEVPHLSALIRDGLKQSSLRRQYRVLEEQQANQISSFVVGRSEATTKLLETVKYAASTSQAVLITGETGTGKGLCAAAIHKFGNRSKNSFVRYQPAFGSPDLVNSDLFGHLKGSFTGADGDRRGLLDEADQGTLFLDEVDELPASTQVALLGVMQDKSFRPLGSNEEQQVDFRLIAASNQNIDRCLKEGKLRQDFYHRVGHFKINLVPLRERKEDIKPQAEFFLGCLRENEQVSVFHFEEGAHRKLIGYDWPGNVRELMAVVEGAAYRAQYEGRAVILEKDFSLSGSGVSEEDLSFHDLVSNYRLKLVKEALIRSENNQVQAAKELGLDRSTLRRILERNK